MSIPPSFLRHGSNENSWFLDCSRCTKVEEFTGTYFFRAMRDVDDSDWELINGEVVCPICVEELEKNKSK